MADPQQTPPRGNWICPCTGCKKARNQAFEEILHIIDNFGGDVYSRMHEIKSYIESQLPKKRES